MRDLSIIISERGEPHNLIWTLQGLEQEFQGSGVDYEYIVVVNGPSDEHPLATEEEYGWLEKKWPWVSHRATLVYNSPGGIYQARNLGARMSKGRYLWFLDAHTLPVPGDYVRAFRFKQSFEGILHLGMRYFLDEQSRATYGYRWKPNEFWGAWTRTKPVPPDYRILMNGGACLLIDRQVWQEIGGYNPGLGIYGGGEPYTDLKAQMFGYQVKSRPDMHFLHLALRRGYHWTQADMWRNFLITSYALGGSKYQDRVYANYFAKCKDNPAWLKSLEATRAAAMVWAIPDREKTLAEAKFTVDEVLDDWREYARLHGHEVEAAV